MIILKALAGWGCWFRERLLYYKNKSMGSGGGLGLLGQVLEFFLSIS
jgi:hypothetical protein